MLFDPQQYTIPASAATMAPSRQAAAAGLCADFQAFTTDEQRGLLLARLNKPEPRLIILPCDPAAVADIGGSGSTHVEFEFELQCGKESVLFFTTRFSAAKEQHRRWSNAGLLASRAAGASHIRALRQRTPLNLPDGPSPCRLGESVGSGCTAAHFSCTCAIRSRRG